KPRVVARFAGLYSIRQLLDEPPGFVGEIGDIGREGAGAGQDLVERAPDRLLPALPPVVVERHQREHGGLAPGVEGAGGGVAQASLSRIACPTRVLQPLEVAGKVYLIKGAELLRL